MKMLTETTSRRGVLRALQCLAVPGLASALFGCGGGGGGGGGDSAPPGAGGAAQQASASGSTFSARLVGLPDVPITDAPFGTIAFEVAGGVQAGDTFDAEYDIGSGARYEYAVRQREGGVLLVELPGGRLDTERLFSAGAVTLTLRRYRAGVASTFAHTHQIKAMPDSRYKVGALILLMQQLQEFSTRRGAEAAVAQRYIDAPSAATYVARTYRPGPTFVTNQDLTSAQAVIIERVLFAIFTALQVPLRPAAPPTPRAVPMGIDTASADEVFPIGAIADQMGITSRKLGDTVMKFGGAAVVVGLIAGSVPIIVGGAAVVMVGLAVGTTNGFVYDNARFIGSSDGSERPRLVETLRFFGSYVLGKAVTAVQRAVGVTSRTINYAVDQALSYGTERLVEAADRSAEEAYKESVAANNAYVNGPPTSSRPTAPTPTPPQTPGAPTPISGPCETPSCFMNRR